MDLKGALELYKQGYADSEVMKYLGITRTKFERMLKNDAYFQEFVEMGRTLSEAWWMEKGREGVTNTKFNTNLYTFIVKNRFNWTSDKEDDSRKSSNQLADIKEKLNSILKQNDGALPKSASELWVLLNKSGAGNA